MAPIWLIERKKERIMWTEKWRPAGSHSYTKTTTTATTTQIVQTAGNQQQAELGPVN